MCDLSLEGYLWDDGHSLAQGVQTDLWSQKTIDYDSSLGLSQPEQGRDQGAFTGPSPPNDANLHPEKETIISPYIVARTQQLSNRFEIWKNCTCFKIHSFGCSYIVFCWIYLILYFILYIELFWTQNMNVYRWVQ